jgi:CRP/FNR family transcriptional regulator, cyclic AMP receptor protein
MTRVVETTPDTLLGIGIFRSLDNGARASIARHCHTYRYPAQHDIVRNQDTSDDVYFVIGGKVRATIFSRIGKEVAFRDMGAGEMFGDLSAIDGRPRCANVITLEESVLLNMRSSAFQDLLRSYPEVAFAVLCGLTELVRHLSDRVVEFSTLGVNNRIHAELLRLAKEYPGDGAVVEITHPPTHADIASRVSTRREAVTRELGRLSDMGLIERRGKSLVVRDLERLARMIDEVKSSPD